MNHPAQRFDKEEDPKQYRSLVDHYLKRTKKELIPPIAVSGHGHTRCGSINLTTSQTHPTARLMDVAKEA